MWQWPGKTLLRRTIEGGDVWRKVPSQEQCDKQVTESEGHDRQLFHGERAVGFQLGIVQRGKQEGEGGGEECEELHHRHGAD